MPRRGSDATPDDAAAYQHQYASASEILPYWDNGPHRGAPLKSHFRIASACRSLTVSEVPVPVLAVNRAVTTSGRWACRDRRTVAGTRRISPARDAIRGSYDDRIVMQAGAVTPGLRGNDGASARVTACAYTNRGR